MFPKLIPPCVLIIICLTYVQSNDQVGNESCSTNSGRKAALQDALKCRMNSLDSFKKEIQSLSSQTKDQAKINDEFNRRVEDQSKQIVNLKEKVDKCDIRLEKVEEKMKTQEEEIKWLKEHLPTTTESPPTTTEVRITPPSNFVAVSQVYKGTRYYLTGPGDAERSDWDAVRECGNLGGGYLAEIGGAEEQEFVEGFLNGQPDEYLHVVISGSDKWEEGTWRHQQTGKELSYFNWFPGDDVYQPLPGGSEEWNCIFMARDLSWHWGDGSCSGLPSDVRFLCEVPF